MTGRDVARIQLPLALWGYHVRAVDEVLDRMAADIEERDARIAQLEAQLSGTVSSGTRPQVWYPRSPRETAAAGGEQQAPDGEESDTASWPGRAAGYEVEYAKQHFGIGDSRR